MSEDDLLTFCWFFCHLLGTLHDAEFLSGLPIQKDELAKMIVIFKELFCEKVLKDSGWNGSKPGPSVTVKT